MKKLAAIAVLAVVAASPVASFAETTTAVHDATDEVTAPVAVERGKMLYSAGGVRIASIYRVTEDGSAQVIYNGKLITVPVATLSDVDGKVTTSLSKKEVGAAK